MVTVYQVDWFGQHWPEARAREHYCRFKRREDAERFAEGYTKADGSPATVIEIEETP